MTDLKNPDKSQLVWLKAESMQVCCIPVPHLEMNTFVPNNCTSSAVATR